MSKGMDRSAKKGTSPEPPAPPSPADLRAMALNDPLLIEVRELMRSMGREPGPTNVQTPSFLPELTVT
jgi:hypothetical protein